MDICSVRDTFACCLLFPWDDGGSLFVQDKAQEGGVDVEAAIVSNEAQFLEFVHEEIYA